jgi:hypothetical protein
LRKAQALYIALSATVVHIRAVDVIDPFEELTEERLREVVTHCIEWGRTVIGWHGGQDRMAERNITGGQILAALRGSLRTESCNAGRWRYSGRKNGINVIFTFDTDEEGNLLVIVTLIRED